MAKDVEQRQFELMADEQVEVDAGKQRDRGEVGEFQACVVVVEWYGHAGGHCLAHFPCLLLVEEEELALFLAE